jgi:diguanylate cyclase (GGDEF)-like protein
MAHREKQLSARVAEVNFDGTHEYRPGATAVTPMVFPSLATPRTATIVPDPVVAVDHAELQVKAVSHVWMLYAALGAAAILVYYLLPKAGWAQAVLLTAVNASAVVAALRAALRTSRLNRLVWIALAASMALSTFANGPYYLYPLITGHAVHFPGPVDVLWLLTYPCYVVALLAIGKQRRGGHQGDLLDAAIMTVAGGTLMWLFVIGPSIRAPGESIFEHMVSAAYPTMDLMVFAVLVRLSLAGLSKSGASRLLVASFIALLAADIVYAVGILNGTYGFGGPTDGLWMASYLLIGIAATHPSARSFPRLPTTAHVQVNKSRLGSLCLAVLVGPLLLVFDGKDVVIVAAASALSFLLVMARMTGLNWSLAALGVELEEQATTDALTGLLNRSAFNHAIVAALQESHERVGMLMIDLDDFKRVNDLAGHSSGDAVLVEVAQRMRSIGRSTDVMARLGGDEFAMLVTGQTDPTKLGERLIEALAVRFLVGGRTFSIGASVGFVMARAGMEPELLTQEADIAMYAAKDRGKNRLVAFTPSMYTEIVDDQDFANELEVAIERNEMRLEYQPIVRLEDEAIVGYEALARWTHPRLGEVPPDRFIPVAEASGAILPLGRWVLRTALHDLTRIDVTRETALTMNVNVSAVQLLEPAFAYEVGTALEKAGVSGEHLVLEITEGAFIDEKSIAGDQLRELRALGIRISVDDFGTGYSSLAYLQRLPVEELKIARLFVDGIDKGHAEGSAARAIIRMCDALSLRCIAEGVERAEQVASLREAGCEFAQGFHLGRPIPIEKVLELRRRSQAGNDTHGVELQLAAAV